jgi:putative transposase
MSTPDRRAKLDKDHEKLSVRRQCRLLSLSRSGVYRPPPEPLSLGDRALTGEIDAVYTDKPFFGSRRIAFELRVNRKRIQRLMRLMGIEALGPKPNTSKPAPGHEIYPYLLRNLTIDTPNQVWAADITYIPLGSGFLYLVAIMDWASRAVLAWRLSNTMDASFCVAALEEALARFGKPEIFNTDQGSQFTSREFTDTLKKAGVQISMDGRGRYLDNIFIERLWRSLKHEDIYLKHYADGCEAREGIRQWFAFYNNYRPHQALGYQTPMTVWREGLGPGGEEAVDMWTALPPATASKHHGSLPTCPQPHQQQKMVA